MKSLKLFTILAATAAMWSCGPEETEPTPNPGDGELTAPVLTVEPTSAIVLDEADATETALTLDWTAASEEDGVTVGYEIYVNVASKDIFTDPQKVTIEGDVLSKAFTTAELNTLAIALGADYGVAASYKVLVYATDAAGDYDAVQSNEVTVTVTPYMAMPTHLVALGASLNWGWTRPEDASANLAKTAEGVYEATGVEMRFGATDGFKLYFPADSGDSGFLAPEDQAAAEFGAMKYFKGGDDQFLPGNYEYENGVYTITADLNEMTITLEKTGDVSSFPDQLIIRGEALAGVANKWANDDPVMILNSTSEGIYELSAAIQINTGEGSWQSVAFWPIIGGGFKDWPEYSQVPDGAFGDVKARESSDPESRFYLADGGLVSAMYTVKVDLNTMKVTFTKSADLVVEDALYIAGDAVSWGWHPEDPLAKVAKVSDGVYEITTTINLGDEGSNGFKIYETVDWGGQHSQDPAGAFGKIISAEDLGNPDPYQFYPGAVNAAAAAALPGYPGAGLANGTYKITINMNDMMLTIVPAE
jgi:hypothetical protein